MNSIKLIKFNLPIDGTRVKNIEELRNHFTIEIIDIYHNGMLSKWLRSRNMIEELTALEDICIDSSDHFSLLKKLCAIFKIEADDMIISSALGVPLEKTEKNFSEIKAQYRAIIHEELKSEFDAKIKKYTDSSRSLNYKNGIVTDKKKKLRWKQDSEEGRYTWDEAMAKFGKNINFSGYDDWRIPTIEELETLVDGKYFPYVDRVGFISHYRQYGARSERFHL
ncbi:MAG: DUF1566 domain-containing protein [Gammaproteobacteria bacterium]|nr:DUF1566 domain-containing protein [Gammaproteobacteria bacterium]MBU1723167.1 DUF1566 domain-containing protein [Gammaproteobacteria bacterium]MBU2005410.1 DUF1566 domain-containing protein [Gammaproteobacteria bacterium]